MSHLMSAQRGKSTYRVISALDCPLTSAPREVLRALRHIEFHATIAHQHVDQDPRRSTNCWNVDRRQSEEGVDTADDVCYIVRGSVIDGVLLLDRMVVNELNGRAIDSASVVGPA